MQRSDLETRNKNVRLAIHFWLYCLALLCVAQTAHGLETDSEPVAQHLEASGNSNTPSAIRIASHELKPYHWLNDSDPLSGPAMAPFSCIMSELNQAYEITVFPWARAQQMVKRGDYDAFFIATETDERNAYATVSKPFYTDYWYLYSAHEKAIKAQSETLTDYYIGVMRGSAMQRWTEKQGFEQILRNGKYSRLFKLLEMGRLDVVIATQGIYQNEMAAQDWPEQKFAKDQVRQLPLGMYFGHHFLEKHPNFLARFNTSVDACTS